MRKYYAKISSVWPKTNDSMSKCSRNAYCGISLTNPNFYGNRLRAILKFLAENFEKTLLVTSGYLYRHHYRLYHESEELSLNYALEKERAYIENELIPALDELGNDGIKLNFVRWEEIFLMNEVQFAHEKLLDFHNEDQLFNKSISELAQNFVLAKTSKGCRPICCSESKAIQLSIDFLLEETSVFNYLVEQNYKTDVYPGIALPALRALQGKNSAPVGLRERCVIELALLKRGSKCTNVRARVIT